jgi:drug/metabolite transporter (DMT)-like permease
VTRRRDAGLFAYLALAWGVSFSAIEVGLRHAPPVLFSALRYDVAAVCLAAYAALRYPDPVPRSRGDLAAVAATGGLVVGCGRVFLFLGQTQTTGAAAALVFAANPVLAAGFARVLLPAERLDAVGALGLFVGFAGVGLVVRPDPGTLAGDTVGELLVFAAAASVALGSVLVRRVDAELGPVPTTAWGVAVGAALTHAASVLRGEPAAVPLAPAFLLALGYVAVVAAAGTYAVYFGLLDRLPAVQVNLVSYATPVVAVVSGWLLLGERVGPADLAGFAVVVVGFALLKRRALRTLLG